MTIPICIDVSHHQGYIDWDTVANAGVKGMIHKATEGTSFEDDMRAENCSGAKNAGLGISTYHWLSPGSNDYARSQMRFYTDTIQPCRGERVVIDYEQDGCELSDLKAAVQELMDLNLDLKITVYSGHLLKEQLGSDLDEFLATNTDLWLAQYTSGTPSWSTGTYEQWSLWQYSENGIIPGIDDAYVDLNNFNGNEEEFLAWISPQGIAPSPVPPHPGKKLVDVTIDAPEGVTVNVTVNGVLTTYKPLRRRLFHRRHPDLKRKHE
jgi:lysozyme